MPPVRRHPDHDASSPRDGGGLGAGSEAGSGFGWGPAAEGGCGPVGGRLNLLLSYAGWQAESWADALPRMLEPMGVRSHRAQDGREASRVIESTPIHIAVVDLSLPLEAGSLPGAGAPELEECGPRLLELLSRGSQPPPTIVMKRERSSRDDAREMAAALRLGAFAVVDRPRHQSDVGVLLEVLRRALSRYYRGRWPGV